MQNKELQKAKDNLANDHEDVQIVKGKAVDETVRKMALVKARLEAYAKVYDNYEEFIIAQVKKLKDNVFEDNTFKELGVARLVSSWIASTEEFLKENEQFLNESDKHVRKSFVEDSLKELPEGIKDKLIDKLNEKKAIVLEWFAKELQLAIKEVRDSQ